MIKISSILNKKTERPASMIVEELRKEVVEWTADLENEKGTSHKEFLKEKNTWK